MYETNFHRAGNLAEASRLFAEAKDEAKYLAGGQTLIPTMKQRLAAPTDLVSISQLPELKGISVDAGTVTVGAAVTHAEVATSSEVRGAIAALCDLAGRIGDPAVRRRGTIGGSLANNDPSADYPAAVLGLGATVHTDKRTVGAEDFFTGLFSTALEDGEIITKVAFPVPEKAAYMKFPNPASRYAMTGVFVAKMKDGSVRVGVTGASEGGAFRATDMEEALASSWSPDALTDIVVDSTNFFSDLHGSADYRANLVKVMARRAVQAIA